MKKEEKKTTWKLFNNTFCYQYRQKNWPFILHTHLPLMGLMQPIRENRLMMIVVLGPFLPLIDLHFFYIFKTFEMLLYQFIYSELRCPDKVLLCFIDSISFSSPLSSFVHSWVPSLFYWFHPSPQSKPLPHFISSQHWSLNWRYVFVTL